MKNTKKKSIKQFKIQKKKDMNLCQKKKNKETARESKYTYKAR